jgi:hypothetical protein
LSHHEQREQLRLYRLNRDLRRPAKALALKHQANDVPEVNWVTVSEANLEQILQKLSSISSIQPEILRTIVIGVARLPGRAVLLSTELYGDLVERGSTN